MSDMKSPVTYVGRRGEKAEGLSRLSLPRLFVSLFVLLYMLHARNIYTHRGSRSKRLIEYSRLILYRDNHSSVYIY